MQELTLQEVDEVSGGCPIVAGLLLGFGVAGSVLLVGLAAAYLINKAMN